MANEIKVTAGLTCTNGELSVQIATASTQVDQVTARGGGPGTLDIGTSEETIAFTDTVPGWIYMKNLDATNFITWGNVTANLDQKLRAGGAPTVIEMVSGGVLILKADTATCKVQIIAINI